MLYFLSIACNLYIIPYNVGKMSCKLLLESKAVLSTTKVDFTKCHRTTLTFKVLEDVARYRLSSCHSLDIFATDRRVFHNTGACHFLSLTFYNLCQTRIRLKKI